MFSRPVNRGWNPVPTWITAPTRPRIATRPLSGKMMPFRIFSIVDLPEPFGPTSPRHSPFRRSKETSSSAQNSSRLSVALTGRPQTARPRSAAV
jgi:hypothetical protein